MTQPRTSRIPAPLYAVAGAGELAYESLRRLPNVLTDFGGKAATTRSELREKAMSTLRNANSTASNLRSKAVSRDFDVDRLRTATIRNAAVVVTNAQAAQERAISVYGELVARGERIIGSDVVQAAETVNADMAATEAPAELTATAETPAPATPATVAEVVQATPEEKRPRPIRTSKVAGADTDTPSAKLPKPKASRTRTSDK